MSDEFQYSVVVGGSVESWDKLVELVDGWTLHPGAVVVAASLSMIPPEGVLPHTAGSDGHVLLDPSGRVAQEDAT